MSAPCDGAVGSEEDGVDVGKAELDERATGGIGCEVRGGALPVGVFICAVSGVEPPPHDENIRSEMAHSATASVRMNESEFLRTASCMMNITSRYVTSILHDPDEITKTARPLHLTFHHSAYFSSSTGCAGLPASSVVG